MVTARETVVSSATAVAARVSENIAGVVLTGSRLVAVDELDDNNASVVVVCSPTMVAAREPMVSVGMVSSAAAVAARASENVADVPSPAAVVAAREACFSIAVVVAAATVVVVLAVSTRSVNFTRDVIASPVPVVAEREVLVGAALVVVAATVVIVAT
jgi:hypothetical protein